MSTIRVKQDVQRIEDGRIASSISIDGSTATTRYYDNGGIMFVAFIGLFNTFINLRDGVEIELDTNVRAIPKALQKDYSYTSKTRERLLATIEHKQLTIKFKN